MSTDRETVDLSDAAVRALERDRVAWNLPRAVPIAELRPAAANTRTEPAEANDEPPADG